MSVVTENEAEGAPMPQEKVFSDRGRWDDGGSTAAELENKLRHAQRQITQIRAHIYTSSRVTLANQLDLVVEELGM